ncbi:LytTR family DNA-binding domain-containing protein [Flammeovirgaceae bacterium SG7u.111]|nr:LytTR family DNA-binding domain-containing protein [Flammeovirgaceae bacterium SG7u.132]WPO34211.1 LytTR family DNA-binding domain-containing protein [Flammeovirgaceae bacterium SG7u.111]
MQIREENRVVISSLFLSVLSGLFLGFSLFVYQAYNIPTGISASGHSLGLRALAFGLTTSLLFAGNEYIYHRFLKLKLLLWRSWEIWCGATATFLLYNYFWNWFDLLPETYFRMFAEYFGIIIIPLSAAYFFEKNAFKEKETQQELPLVFTSSNGKQSIQMEAEDFLYAKAEDNYVKIFYLKNNEPKSVLLREKLSNIEKQLIVSQFARCHRSYLVNKANISHVEKKNQRVLLHLKNVEDPLPVSASYVQEFS